MSSAKGRLPQQQEIGYELPAAWREDRRKPRSRFLTVFASQRSNKQTQRKNQRRKKGKKHLEGHGLRHRTALRNDSRQSPEQFLPRDLIAIASKYTFRGRAVRRFEALRFFVQRSVSRVFSVTSTRPWSGIHEVHSAVTASSWERVPRCSPHESCGIVAFGFVFFLLTHTTVLLSDSKQCGAP